MAELLIKGKRWARNFNFHIGFKIAAFLRRTKLFNQNQCGEVNGVLFGPYLFDKSVALESVVKEKVVVRGVSERDSFDDFAP